MFKLLLFFSCFSMFIYGESPVIIGIAGGTASGKTTLAKKIQQACPESILICTDSYYKDLSDLSIEERNNRNFDHPDSIEFSLLINHLIDLKNGLSVEQPIFNYHLHNREKETLHVNPAKIIIVEGILVLALPEMRDLLDLKIYVDLDADVRILRCIERDKNERSRDFSTVKELYLNLVKPMFNLHIEPTKMYADIIIPGGNNQKAIDLVVHKLNSYSN